MYKILKIDTIIPIKKLNDSDVAIFTYSILKTFGLPVFLEYTNTFKEINPQVLFAIDCSSDYVMAIALIEKNINYLIIKNNKLINKVLKSLIKENNRNTIIFNKIKDFTNFLSVGNLKKNN